MSNWRATQRYRADVPDEGPRIGIGLVAGTVVSEDDLAHFRPGLSGAEVAAWINRDAPGTLEATDDDADATPERHVPAYLSSGVARVGTQVDT